MSQLNNAIGRLQAGANQADIARHMGFWCVTTKVVSTESDHPNPTLIYPVDGPSGWI